MAIMKYVGFLILFGLEVWSESLCVLFHPISLSYIEHSFLFLLLPHLLHGHPTHSSSSYFSYSDIHTPLTPVRIILEIPPPPRHSSLLLISLAASYSIHLTPLCSWPRLQLTSIMMAVMMVTPPPHPPLRWEQAGGRQCRGVALS